MARYAFWLLVIGMLAGCSKSPGTPVLSGGTAPSAAAKAARITFDAVEKIQLGMSDAEVKQVLGAPDVEGLAGDQKDLVLSWSEGGRNVTLILSPDRKVKSKVAAGLPSDAARMTQANFDKAQVGMARAAVLDLLGPASQVNDEAKQQVLTWEQGTVVVNVIFEAGVVKSKAAVGW